MKHTRKHVCIICNMTKSYFKKCSLYQSDNIWDNKMNTTTHLKLDSSAQSSIDAYLEYKRIVGDDDGGILFTEEEYENYKKNILPQREKNRLYVSWSNHEGMDCKLIGPETPCFCQHRYKQHKTDFKNIPSARPIFLPCTVKNCPCSSYQYIPSASSAGTRCHCKHLSTDHSSKLPNPCTKSSCACDRFTTSLSCACGELAHNHEMIVETREERLNRGHPVVKNESGYAAMGGITGFSSLVDGYMRLDDSGIGTPPVQWLNQPTTSRDHPFLRALDPTGVQPAVKSARQRALEYNKLQSNRSKQKTSK